MRHLTLISLIALFVGGCGGNSSPIVPLGPFDDQAPSIAAGEGYINGASVVDSMANSAMTLGDNSLAKHFIGVLAFDITGIGTVQHAELTLQQGVPTGVPWTFGPLFVDHIVGDGVIEASQATSAALTAEAHALTDEPTWTLDVTDLVAADVAAGRTVTTLRFRFAIETNADGQNDFARIATSQWANADGRPNLMVTHTIP